MDLLDKIGPALGIASFLGLAVIAFLVFSQAREVRRLRRWAGQAPDRAGEASEAEQAAAEARGDVAEEPKGPGWFTRAGERVGAALEPRWAEFDRRSPVDARWVLVGIAAVIAAGVLTGGFGVLGGEEKTASPPPALRADKPVKVAILNATQELGVQGVPGIADKVAKKVVESKRFKPTAETDAKDGLDASTIYYEVGAKLAAAELAKAVRKDLGDTATTPMLEPIRKRAEGAPLALLIGRDDAGF